MRVVVLRDRLSAALSKLSGVAGSNKTLPVLSNIKLETAGSSLKLSATNLEIAMIVEVGGKVEAEGSITLPARLLTDYVSALPVERVEMTAEDSIATISAGGYSSSINGIAVDEFPELPTAKSDNPITISPSRCKEIIDHTQFSVSVDSSRPTLGGVYFDLSEGYLACVSTDSYRLSLLKTDVKTSFEPFIIPRGTLAAIARSLGSDDIVLHPEEGQVGIEIGSTHIVSRLVEGAYPNYNQLIPTESDTRITIDRKELINAVKIAGLFSRETAGSINLIASAAGAEVRLESSAGQVGDNRSAVKAEVSADAQVSLNSKYLIDGLSTFDCDLIEVWVTGRLSPCVLVDPKGSKYTHLIMPLRS